MSKDFQMSFTALILCAFLAYADLSMSTDLFRWTDVDGVTHFSDQPPPTVSTKEKTVKFSKIPERSSSRSQREYMIPFEKIYGGMLVEVLINDRVPAKLIVDTGATTVIINQRLLKKLNLQLPPDVRKGKAMTAAGVVDAQEVFIDKIDLGGAVKKDVQAAFINQAYDNPYYDGLLGLSFLSEFKMTIDYEKNVIHLTR